MRNGYILLHRQGLTTDEWKHPLRTLAWIDLLTMAAWEEFTNEDGVSLKRGEIIASISFLEARWRQNRGTIHRWLTYWETEKMVQRVTQHPSQQLPQRLFVVNYAKYQGVPQQVSQLQSQQVSQPMKVKQEKENKNIKHTVGVQTQSLLDFITELCQQTGLENKVNARGLDVQVSRYNNLQLRVETRSAVTWLLDKGKRQVSTSFLGNWFKKATEIQKRDTNRLLEKKQEHFKIDPATRAKLLSFSPQPNVQQGSI